MHTRDWPIIWSSPSLAPQLTPFQATRVAKKKRMYADDSRNTIQDMAWYGGDWRRGVSERAEGRGKVERSTIDRRSLHARKSYETDTGAKPEVRGGAPETDCAGGSAYVVPAPAPAALAASSASPAASNVLDPTSCDAAAGSASL